MLSAGVRNSLPRLGGAVPCKAPSSRAFSTDLIDMNYLESAWDKSNLGDPTQICWQLSGRNFRQSVLQQTPQKQLTHAQIDFLSRCLQGYEKNKDVHGAVVRTVGSDNFISGWNWKTIFGKDLKDTEAYSDLLNAAFRLAHTDRNVFVFIDGLVSGPGMAFALSSDRVVSDHTRVISPECGMGLIPYAGATYRYARMPSSYGTYLALTGTEMRGQDNMTSFFGSHYFERELFPTVLSHMSDNAGPIDSFRGILNQFDEFARNRTDNMLDPYRELIHKAFGKDSVQEIMEVLASEPVHVDFARATLRQLSAMSPLSLALTHRMVKESEVAELYDILRLEFRVMQRLLQPKQDFSRLLNDSFLPGIRWSKKKSKFVYRSPEGFKWAASSVEEIDEATVDSYLGPLTDAEQEQGMTNLLLAHDLGDQPYRRPDPFQYAKGRFDNIGERGQLWTNSMHAQFH